MSGSSRYQQPEKGTANWHVPLNENFAQLGLDMDAVEAAITTLENEKADASDLTAALGGKSDVGHTHAGDTLEPAALNGSVINRDEDVTSLPGNIYYVPEGSSDPTTNDGDIVFYYETP